MPNEWLGYSERGFIGALFHDLCETPDAIAVLKHAVSESCTNEAFVAAVLEANEVTTILELGLSNFGDVDGLIVLRNGPDPTAAFFVEAKRRPLFAEWTDNIGNVGDSWNASQIVVQIARKFALMNALQSGHPSNHLQFTSQDDYWMKQPRKMKLDKETVVNLLGKLAVGEVPTCVATLTASAWMPSQTSGDAAFWRILDSWNLAEDDRLIHLGFEAFLKAGKAAFPLLCRTFSLCCWDTMFDGSNWSEWYSHAEDQFGPDALTSLDDWASREGLTWVREHNCTQPVNTLNLDRRAVARTRGCYGVGGPILDLQFRIDTHFGIPAGWTRWDTGLTLAEIPIAGTRWRHNFLVPSR
jgi:hypothetical protein